MKMNAYHAKFPDTIPVVYPALAEANNIEGPTLVPHMLSPMEGHVNECSARNIFSFSFFFFTKLTQ
jgi:hypothetical protein